MTIVKGGWLCGSWVVWCVVGVWDGGGVFALLGVLVECLPFGDVIFCGFEQGVVFLGGIVKKDFDCFCQCQQRSRGDRYGVCDVFAYLDLADRSACAFGDVEFSG